MKLLVKGRNVDVSDKVHSYAEKRLGKLSRQLDDDVTRVELEISEERNPRVSEGHVAEVTIWTKGPTIRAKEASHDTFASIDLVVEKLARQVQKYREKRQRKHVRHLAARANSNGNGNGNGGAVRLEPITEEQRDMADTDAVKIVKTKQFQLGPMTPEEAALQMDLVGHDFFVFVNSDTNQTSVLYKRSDGNYGLIEPTLTEAEVS